MRKSRSARAAFGALLVALVAAPAAHAGLSRADATAAALSALGVSRSQTPVIVFSLPQPLGPHTTVGQDGPGAGQKSRVRYIRGVPHLQVRLSHNRIGHEAWLFWEDLAPYAQFAHPSVLLALDAGTGRILLERGLSWEPLIDGRLPAFLRSASAYANPSYRVFARGTGASAAVAARVPRATTGAQPSQTSSTGNLTAGLQAAFNWAQSNLLTFNSLSNPSIRAGGGRRFLNECGYSVSVVGEPYGNSPPWFGYGAGSFSARANDGSAPQSSGRLVFQCGGSSDLTNDCMVILYDRSDPRFGADVNALVGLTRALNIRAYKTTSIEGLDRALTALQAKRPPCAAITIAIVAHGYAPPDLGGSGAEWPTAAVSLLGTSLEIAGYTWEDDQVLDAPTLARVLARHPGPVYNLLLQSCFSGRWTGAASGAGGTVVASSRSYQESWFSFTGGADDFLRGMISGLAAWKANPGGFVTITAMPAPGSEFDHWSSPQGLCSGTADTCTFPMDPSHPFGNIALYFRPKVFQLTVTNTNNYGLVSCCSAGRNDVLPGIGCGVQYNGSEQLSYTDCEAVVREQQGPYDYVTLNLTAVAAIGPGTWGIQSVDGCDQLVLSNAPVPGGSGTYHPTGNCIFTMHAARNVTVTWVQVSTQTG